jgi:hypothetical protein
MRASSREEKRLNASGLSNPHANAGDHANGILNTNRDP